MYTYTTRCMTPIFVDQDASVQRETSGLKIFFNTTRVLNVNENFRLHLKRSADAS